MDNQLLDESFVEAKEMGELASFGQRLGALLIDAFIIIFLVFLVFFAAGGFQYIEAILSQDSEALEGITEENVLIKYIIYMIVIAVAQWLYYALMESSDKQGTLGKMAMGLIVTDMMGQKLTFGKASVRFWVRTLPTYIPFNLGLLYALVDGFSQLGTSNKQTIHDIVAGTLVYNK
jgi:uncharacterized RDD family membrane protein YckC